jgi:tRNA (guanine-N7-)-methyltransferase
MTAVRKLSQTKRLSHDEPGRIRSFVVRAGRMSPQKQAAILQGLTVQGLPFKQQLLDWSLVFGREAPRVLEIGFGMGQSFIEIVGAQLDHDFVGIEVHPPGVGNTLDLIAAQGLTNVRLIQHDAVEVLREMIALGSLDRIQVFFPDPWPKKRHNKRRILQPEFVQQLALRLKPGGLLHVATDWVEYAEHILAVCNAEPLLNNTAIDYATKPDYRPLTKFEQRGLNLGHEVRDLLYCRV